MLNYVWYVLIGVAAGFCSALLGIGGGVIMVPALVLLFGLVAEQATATSLAWIVPIAAVGALLAWRQGTPPRWHLALLAAPSGVAGAFLGRWVSGRISGAHVKLLFAVLMVLVGVRLGLDGWRGLRGQSGPAAAPAEATGQGPSESI